MGYSMNFWRVSEEKTSFAAVESIILLDWLTEAIDNRCCIGETHPTLVRPQESRIERGHPSNTSYRGSVGNFFPIFFPRTVDTPFLPA